MQKIRFSKQFKAVIPLAFKSGRLIKNDFTDQQIMICWKVWQNLEDIVALGWGILDGLIVMPLYRCLANYVYSTWAIILFTVLYW
jgi:hypothetical protein